MEGSIPNAAERSHKAITVNCAHWISDMEDAGDLIRSSPGSPGIRSLNTVGGGMSSTEVKKPKTLLFVEVMGGTGQKPEWESLTTETPSRSSARPKNKRSLPEATGMSRHVKERILLCCQRGASGAMILTENTTPVRRSS